MPISRMDNVLIVVDDLEASKAFFIELGLTLEGQTTVEGPAVGKLIGLENVRATLAMLRTPDGQGIELDKFHTPEAVRFGPVNAPVNTLGIRRLMFAVEVLATLLARMLAYGAELIGEMQYEDTYRLAYIRGPEGIIVGLVPGQSLYSFIPPASADCGECPRAACRARMRLKTSEDLRPSSATGVVSVSSTTSNARAEDGNSSPLHGITRPLRNSTSSAA